MALGESPREHRLFAADVGAFYSLEYRLDVVRPSGVVRVAPGLGGSALLFEIDQQRYAGLGKPWHFCRNIAFASVARIANHSPDKTTFRRMRVESLLNAVY